MTKAYKLRPNGGTGLLMHSSRRPKLLRDYPDDGVQIYIDNLVDSGGYFVNLATEIDDSIKLVNIDPEAARAQLQKASRTLLYMQGRYKIVSKSALDYER